ncbi:MAG: hypothetical protein AB7O97_24230 [Planctomycetota bacterium]
MNQPPPKFALYAGLGMLTCSMLLVQQFLTRIFSIQFNSGLAFLAISTTFLGLGSAGVAIAVLPRLFAPERVRALLAWLGVVYAALLVGGFAVEVVVDRALLAAVSGQEPLSSQVGRVVVASLLMLPALFTVGLCIALVLRANSDRVGKLYGADLAGGGLGCLLVLPLMGWIGGDQGIFAIGALAGGGAALLAHAHGHARARGVALALTAAMLALPFANGDRALVDVRSHRTVMADVASWVDEDHELDREWNALSRLGFFPTTDQSHVYVRIDSSCQTAIPAVDPAVRKRIVAESDFERLPFALDRHRRCLEIGAGGGRGLVLAAASGAERVTGVEINPDIVGGALGRFPGYGVEDLVADPAAGVRLLVGEGRSHVRATDERFDSLTITFIQTGVASGSAAFALSEANLFTKEAFADFFGALDDDGVFYVYRHTGIECLRLVSMLREVLQELGAADFRQHLYIARNDSSSVLVLAGRSPLRAQEIERLDATATSLGLDVMYAPGGDRAQRPPNPFLDRIAALRAGGAMTMGAIVDAFRRTAHDPAYEPLEATYVRAADPKAFEAAFPIDVSAPTDDRPYFFFTGLNHPRDYGLYFDPAGTGILGGTVILLTWMGVAFTALVALLIVLPLLLPRLVRRGAARAGFGRAGWWVLLYFGGIGIGYMAVQISFIQRFTLFLGHPVYAVSVVLLGFLVASGLGSVLSERAFASGRLGFGRAVALLVTVLLLFNWLLPAVFGSAAIGWPVAAKIALSLALIFVLALPMGMFFPQGVRLCERVAPDLVPWAWGANSAASVIGSILSLILAIHAGFAVVAVVAACVYALTTLPAAAALRRA